jgi:hypothetical protein
MAPRLNGDKDGHDPHDQPRQHDQAEERGAQGANTAVQHRAASGLGRAILLLALRATIGFQPDAQARRLYVDPNLPDWMPTMELSDLRLGAETIDLSLSREGP